MRFHRIHAGLMALLLLLPLLAVAQGITWETTTTLPMGGGRTMTSTSMYLPHRFKQVSDGAATIFRLDKKLLLRVNYNTKEYSEVTFTELEGMVKEADGQMEAQLADLKKQLASMPEE